MPDGFFLSEKDRDLLREVTAWWKSRRNFDQNAHRGRQPRTGPAHFLTYFELSEDLELGGTAAAWKLVETADGLELPAVEDREIIVVADSLVQCRGRGKDKFDDPHDDGSRGLARYNAARAKWTIVQIQPPALIIRGLLTADLATTGGTFTIDGLSIMQPVGGMMIDQDPADPITVYNVFSWEGDNNGVCIAAWNEDTGHWEAVNVECPA